MIRFPAFVAFPFGLLGTVHGTVSYLAVFLCGMGNEGVWDGMGKERKGQDRIGWDETE